MMKNKVFVLKLRVIANSDAYIDQVIKLRVRDALMQHALVRRAAGMSFIKAWLALHSSIGILCLRVSSILLANGCTYGVKAKMRHNTLLIELGKAQGRNWWGLLFPSMSMPDSADMQAEGLQFHSTIFNWLKFLWS